MAGQTSVASVADMFPLDSLYPDRYQYRRTKVFEILNYLKIKRIRVGKKCFITLEDLKLVDHYVDLLKQGDQSQIDAFLNSEQVRKQVRGQVDGQFHEPVRIDQRLNNIGDDGQYFVGGHVDEHVRQQLGTVEANSSMQVQQSPAWLMLIESVAVAIADQLEHRAPQAAKDDPLKTYRQIDEVSQQGYVLSTSDMRSLIGVKPRQQYQWGCFTIYRSNHRVGRQAGWVIKKSADDPDVVGTSLT
jgi:hypothetical protein